MSNQDWQKLVREKKDALRQIHFGVGQIKTKDVKLAKKTRREIARLLTTAAKAK